MMLIMCFPVNNKLRYKVSEGYGETGFIEFKNTMRTQCYITCFSDGRHMPVIFVVYL